MLKKSSIAFTKPSHPTSAIAGVAVPDFTGQHDFARAVGTGDAAPRRAMQPHEQQRRDAGASRRDAQFLACGLGFAIASATGPPRNHRSIPRTGIPSRPRDDRVAELVEHQRGEIPDRAADGDEERRLRPSRRSSAWKNSVSQKISRPKNTNQLTLTPMRIPKTRPSCKFERGRTNSDVRAAKRRWSSVSGDLCALEDYLQSQFAGSVPYSRPPS